MYQHEQDAQGLPETVPSDAVDFDEHDVHPHEEDSQGLPQGHHQRIRRRSSVVTLRLPRCWWNDPDVPCIPEAGMPFDQMVALFKALPDHPDLRWDARRAEHFGEGMSITVGPVLACCSCLCSIETAVYYNFQC